MSETETNRNFPVSEEYLALLELDGWNKIEVPKKYDPFDFSVIPIHMMQNMLNYVKGTEVLGGFLYQVFSNKLFEAYAAADDYNQKIVLTYVKFIYNKLPFNCHGSEEIVKNWMNRKQEKNNE